ncbi:MAG: hypothetical protein N4A44_03950 [Alphaproteobacteria bacterium]|jgi:hypothetical protein|nr:hypothetical protein [Alphaproteobacteria bacterium]
MTKKRQRRQLLAKLDIGNIYKSNTQLFWKKGLLEETEFSILKIYELKKIHKIYLLREVSTQNLFIFSKNIKNSHNFINLNISDEKMIIGFNLGHFNKNHKNKIFYIDLIFDERQSINPIGNLSYLKFIFRENSLQFTLQEKGEIKRCSKEKLDIYQAKEISIS